MNKIKIRIILFIFTFLISALVNLCYSYSKDSIEYKILYFEKANELKENFSTDENSFFWSISDICCDNNNNLYVADSGLNKVFKFDAKGKYVASFGREGQGPGEFLASPRVNPLMISFGNDGNIYVTDLNNKKLSIFTERGEYIKRFSLPSHLRDKAQVNSKGDIYLASNINNRIIHCYDKDFRHKESFFNAESHFQFPIYKPKKVLPNRINFMHIKKIITKDDQLIVFSNYSLKMFHFDKENRILNNFMINNKIFLENFKKRLKSAIKQGSFIVPFAMFVDSNKNLCFCYYNSSIRKREVYRYTIDGKLLDVIRFRNEIWPTCYCADDLGNYYVVTNNGTQIEIYKQSL